VDGRDFDPISALEADFAVQAAADSDLDRDGEVAERVRIERSSVGLHDRLVRSVEPVDLTVAGGQRITGVVTDSGQSWCVVSETASTVEFLFVSASVVTARGLGRGMSARKPSTRSLASVLREWCRDRSQVMVYLVDGSRVVGMGHAAYADHVEVLDDRGGMVAISSAAIAAMSRTHIDH